MIAYCGLDCSKCDAFLATARDDNAMRAKVADEWSRAFEAQIKPEDINCTGCRSDGVKFNHCENVCEIRKCGSGRGVGTCADCSEFACDRLSEFFRMAPQAKENLEGLTGK